MADAPPTRLHIDPPMDQWRVTPRNGRTTPVIATGHQPTLWHPGILAKYLAADAFAEQIGGSTLNVVVDHNTLDLNLFPYPIVEGQRLGTRSIAWDRRVKAAFLPPNVLPPLTPVELVDSVSDALNTEGMPRSVREGLGRIAQAYEHSTEQASAAEQISAVLANLMNPFLYRPIPERSSTRLVTQGLLDRLLADPVKAVRCYNRAALAYPGASIRPLYFGRDVVEAPLWAQDTTFCTPVYIDLGDSKRPQLFTTGRNQHLDLTGGDALRHLRPRAITISAIMRSELCDLFIHGTGGGVYDQVTERWWHDWVGEDLAPKAVVSADVYLPFDVPTATPSEHARAQWFDHHLQHNVDRYAEELCESDTALADEKRALLDQMNDDRDKRRRSRAFKRIHAINAELRRRHAVLIRSAWQRAEDARIGVANAAIAHKRDWCFALYPAEQIDRLKQQLTASRRGD